jgi:hypothetical protein
VNERAESGTEMELHLLVEIVNEEGQVRGKKGTDLPLQIIFHRPDLTRDHSLEQDLRGLLSEQRLLHLRNNQLREESEGRSLTSSSVKLIPVNPPDPSLPELVTVAPIRKAATCLSRCRTVSSILSFQLAREAKTVCCVLI